MVIRQLIPGGWTDQPQRNFYVGQAAEVEAYGTVKCLAQHSRETCNQEGERRQCKAPSDKMNQESGIRTRSACT